MRLSRSVSPALVAEYHTREPDEALLQSKLHEFYELAQQQASLPSIEPKNPATRQPKKPAKARKKSKCSTASRPHHRSSKHDRKHASGRDR
jgi:hypothetical protein